MPSAERSVEAELKQGKIVVVLFWSKNGVEDHAVHAQVQQLGKGSAHTGPIAVHYAEPGQVTSFGSITRGVQVYATPTILIINKRGQTTTLTGLQDALSIEQAIDEARHS